MKLLPNEFLEALEHAPSGRPNVITNEQAARYLYHNIVKLTGIESEHFNFLTFYTDPKNTSYAFMKGKGYATGISDDPKVAILINAFNLLAEGKIKDISIYQGKRFF